MKIIKFLLVFIWVILNFSAFACAPGTTRAGNDILTRELSRTQDEISVTRGELLATKVKLSSTENDLNTSKNKLITAETSLSNKSKELEDTKNALKMANAQRDQYRSDYEALSNKYEDLNKKYTALTEGTVKLFTPGDVEQALFKLINRERKNNTLNELAWNSGLYSTAQANNRNMAATKSLQNSEDPSLMQVFWFLGSGSSESIANLALSTWKSNSYSYNQNVLNSNATNGAVAAYQLQEILYITFMCYTNAPYR